MVFHAKHAMIRVSLKKLEYESNKISVLNWKRELHFMSHSVCKRSFKDWQYFKLQLSFENEEAASHHKIDLVTWKQLLNNALKSAHGTFGEGIEYFFLQQDDKIAYLKVSYLDKDTFSSAISTYISSEDLTGVPMTVTILQEESSLTSIEVGDADKLWIKKALEESKEDSECN